MFSVSIQYTIIRLSRNKVNIAARYLRIGNRPSDHIPLCHMLIQPVRDKFVVTGKRERAAITTVTSDFNC